MADHYIKKCKHCDEVIGQCRCPGPKTIKYGVCDKCSKNYIAEIPTSHGGAMDFLTKLKPGVFPQFLTPQNVLGIMIAERVWFSIVKDADFVVTSLFDGKHKPGSKHYSGHAFDFRTRTATEDQQAQIKLMLTTCLGECWDVVLEKDHFHIEYDPHKIKE